MTHRVFVAVDDSPAALAAARLAVHLARYWNACVRAVTVVSDHLEFAEQPVLVVPQPG